MKYWVFVKDFFFFFFFEIMIWSNCGDCEDRDKRFDEWMKIEKQRIESLKIGYFLAFTLYFSEWFSVALFVQHNDLLHYPCDSVSETMLTSV